MPRLTIARAAAIHLAVLASLTTASSLSAQSDDERRDIFNSIEWTDGPAEGRLGDVAHLAVPENCRFTGAKGAETFLELTENPTSGTEVGLLLCSTESADSSADPQRWFVVYEYDASGYVKDDEKTQLDADKILSTLREGNAAGNRERRRRGWSELTLDGWIRPPYYDESTNNLTWATRVIADGDTAANHSVRLLGRGGVMKVDLVTDPAGLTAVLPSFDGVVATTKFNPGNTYAEWRSGDKVAAYGLTALVAGGAAVKLGLFGKLWKLILAGGKAIIVGVVAALAWARSLFRRKKTQAEATPA
ncbi:MAG TPA: DUF2167 domain-containing protein [Gemmatimonadaceae bacterium]|nr:DUF2167 domain-containing protein [Gemmatimonadaceae bacterium]